MESGGHGGAELTKKQPTHRSEHLFLPFPPMVPFKLQFLRLDLFVCVLDLPWMALQICDPPFTSNGS